MGGKGPERAGGQEGRRLAAALCTIGDIVTGVCCALWGDGRGCWTRGWELLWSVLHSVPEGCDSIPGEAGRRRDARAEGAECRTARVSLGDTRPRGSHQGACPSPMQLCSCTPAVGPEPSLQRQALSLYCPAKMQPQPRDGAGSWAEQTAPGSQSPLFTLKGLTPARLFMPGWDSHSSLLSGVCF